MPGNVSMTLVMNGVISTHIYDFLLHNLTSNDMKGVYISIFSLSLLCLSFSSLSSLSSFTHSFQFFLFYMKESSAVTKPRKMPKLQDACTSFCPNSGKGCKCTPGGQNDEPYCGCCLPSLDACVEFSFFPPQGGLAVFNLLFLSH